jgi:hypothetical protein
MSFLALVGYGFLGLTSGGLAGHEPIPIAPLVRSLSVEPQAPSGSGIFIPIHKPSHFPFVIIVADDGTDKAGGWQAAKANLPFQKFDAPITLITWYCPITIGMPIRHSARGYISPATAATMSANVTNSVTSRMDFDLPQGIFCDRFRAGVRAAF